MHTVLYQQQLTSTHSGTSESCRELPGAGADDGALNYQSFYFVVSAAESVSRLEGVSSREQAGTTCQEYTNGGCNIT